MKKYEAPQAQVINFDKDYVVTTSQFPSPSMVTPTNPTVDD